MANEQPNMVALQQGAQMLVAEIAKLPNLPVIADANQINATMRDILAELQEIRREQQRTRQELGDLRQDVRTLRQEVGDVRQQVVDLQRGPDEFQHE